MRSLALLTAVTFCFSPVVSLAQPRPDPAVTQAHDEKTAAENAAVVRRAIEAVNSGKEDNYIQTLSIHHGLRRLAEPERILRGPAEAWSAVSELRGSLGEFTFTPTRVIAGRHFAAVLGVVKGQNTKALEGIAPSRRTLTAHALYFAFMRGGAIRNSLLYFGTDDLLFQAAADQPWTPLDPDLLQVVTKPTRVNTATIKVLQETSLLAVRARLAGLSGDPSSRTMLRRLFRPEDLRVVTRIGEVQAAFRDLALNLNELFAAGDYVIIFTVIRGTITSPVGLLTKMGQKIDARSVIVMKIAAGRAEAVEIFLDQRPLARQLGLSFPPKSP